jgi:PIN domain nuclease of toxin-antitoxin system
MTVVLDSSALLASLLGEAGAATVEAEYYHAVISTVNLAEVVEILGRRGNTPEQVRQVVEQLKIPAIPPEAEVAVMAGLFRTDTKKIGLSLGDRFCLALGRSLGAPVLTSDQAWLQVADLLEVRVELIR